VGARTGRGYREGLSLGLRGALLLAFWALLGFSIFFMVRRSTKMLYDNAGEAVLDVPVLMLHYGRLMADANFLVILFLGGAVGGLLAEWAGRRWS